MKGLPRVSEFDPHSFFFLTRARESSASTLLSEFTLAKAHQVTRKSEALRQFEWTIDLVLVEQTGRHFDFLPQCFQTPVAPGVETSRQLPTALQNLCREKKNQIPSSTFFPSLINCSREFSRNGVLFLMRTFQIFSWNLKLLNGFFTLYFYLFMRECLYI